jgi:hypothetical protein
MTKRLSRFKLVRSVIGAAAAMIICVAALFGAAHHLAG